MSSHYREGDFYGGTEKNAAEKKRKEANSAKHDYLLSGLIMCEHCGQAMTGSTSSKKGGPEYDTTDARRKPVWARWMS